MNKKNIGIIGIVLLAIILLIITSFINPEKTKKQKLSDDIEVILANAEKESEEANNNPTKQKEFTEIDVTTYLDYYNGEEEKIVLVARPTCHYCQIAEPILHKIAYEYDLEINYLNTDNFKDDDSQNFKNSNEKFSVRFGTPMLLFVSDGKINDNIDGLTDYEHYIKFFKDNKFIT